MAAPEGNQYAKANSKYNDSYPELARKLCLLGCTDAELATFFDVTETTINNWKIEHPMFLESVKKGKEMADMDVALKLYDRAVGAEWVEEQAFKVKVGRDEEKIEVVEVKKAAPPDTTALIFWLKNSKPDRWRDKQEHTHSGDPDNPIKHEVDYKNLSDDELRAIIAKGGSGSGASPA